MQNAWICYWSLCETKVTIRPNGKDDPRQVTVAVKHDPAAKRLYCEYAGVSYHLSFV